MTELFRQFLSTLHIPGQLHLFMVLCIASLVSLLIGLLLGVKVQQRRSSGPERTQTKPPSREQQNGEVLQQIRDLRNKNTRYRYLLTSIPRIIRQLNTTVDPEEISKSIARLAGELLHTDTVHLYMYDNEEQYLRKAFSTGFGSEEIDGFALGEGIVGRAARDQILTDVNDDETYSYENIVKEENPSPESTELSLATPIRFEGRLIGVLGVGNITNPSVDTKDLLKMSAEIAGVSLYNRAFLGEAEKDAATDPLTGLYNRRQFFVEAREEVKKVVVHGGLISFILFDIDNFKNYNDTNGHGEGDNLLKEMSRLVTENSRKSSVVARYGGEEFIIMLPGLSKKDAGIYACRMCDTIADHPFAHREKQPLGTMSISGGVATYPTDGNSIQEVIRLADSSLYRAKERGRNRIEIHSRFLFEEDGPGEDSPISSQ